MSAAKRGVRYPPEVLDPSEDDGTMPDGLAALAEAVVGHRVAKVEQAREGRHWTKDKGEATIRLTLDNGMRVAISETEDCCAYTDIEKVVLHLDRIDHVITGVGTTGGYTTWHIYADLGDVLEFQVGWSCGNPFYYLYGLSVSVESC